MSVSRKRPLKIWALLVPGVAMVMLLACSSARAVGFSFGGQFGWTGHSTWRDNTNSNATIQQSRFAEYNSGVTVGVLGRIGIYGTSLALQSDVAYTTLGVEGGHLGYIDLPLLLVSSFPANWTLRPRVYGGPHYAILVHRPSTGTQELANRIGIMVGIGLEYDLEAATLAFDLRGSLTDRPYEFEQRNVHVRILYLLMSIRSR